MKRFYNETYTYIQEILKTSVERGLKSSEVKERREKLGNNKITIPSFEKSNIKDIFKIKEIYLLLHLISVIYVFIIREYILGIMLLISLLAIFYIKFIVSKKNKSQIEYIDKINKATIEVIRDGRETIIKSEEIVIGDIVCFKKDSLIPADIRIAELKDLKVCESSVTGESFLKEKYDYKMASNPSNIGEISNMLFKGSIIKKGYGKGIVVGVGNRTYLGSILSNLKDKTFDKESIYEEIEKKISLQTISLIGLGVMLTIFFRNTRDGLEFSKILFMIFGVPMISLLFIQVKFINKYFKEKDINIVNPSVIKKIQNIDILFLEKMGWISSEEMVVNSLYTNSEIILGEEITYSGNNNLKRALDILGVSSRGIYDKEKNIEEGEIKDRCYLKFLYELGGLREGILYKNKEIFKIEMESNKRFLTTVSKVKKGYRCSCRGHVENILELCTHIMINGVAKELTLEEREKIRKNNYNFLTKGLTAEGLAYRNFEYKPDMSSNIESNLVFVGIIVLENKLDNRAKERILEIKKSGAVPILFTDDNKITATTIGLKTGIIHNKDEVLTGVEITSLDEEEMINVLKKVRIFSKITPEVKMKIVNLFIKEKYKVLVVGEGIGELSNLSLARVGVGKEKGLAIVKRISDVIIEKDYFNKIKCLRIEGENFYKRILEINKAQFISLGIGIVILTIIGLLKGVGIDIIPLIIGLSSVYIINSIGITKNIDVKKVIILNVLIFLIVGWI